jgi:hypothetical protein
MEWIPEMKNLKPSKDKCEVTPDHLKLLNKAFKLFDGNADGRLEIDELKQMVWTMGYHETRGEIDDMIARVNKSSFDFQEVVDVLQSQQYIGIEDGRYFAALSLFEAETLRAILHNGGEIDRKYRVALRVQSDYVIDRTKTFPFASKVQQNIADQIYRFVDSQTSYQPWQLNILLKSTRKNVPSERERWFVEVRKCRRRKQIPWRGLSIASLFTIKDEFALLGMKAMVRNVGEHCTFVFLLSFFHLSFNTHALFLFLSLSLSHTHTHRLRE